MRSESFRARVALAIFSAMVFAQLLGQFPGLEQLAGAFPTYFHKVESIVLVSTLFVSLFVGSFGPGKYTRVIHVVFGALAFYSLAKLVWTFRSDAPFEVRVIWACYRVFVVTVLMWLMLGAVKLRVYGWKEAFCSLALANIGFAYLVFVPVLAS